ncbi:MAG: hypothetical protein PVI79_12835 [Gammaproteobacteria bacterium]|jgi:hypothetical protein
MTKARLRLLVLSALIAGVQACSGGAGTPEEAVRALVESAEDAAERRSTDDLVELVHDDFRDQQGYNKKQVGGLLRAYFFRNRNIHLFTRIDEIEWLGDERATVSLHVAMASSAISDIDALASLRARIYRFRLELVKQGEWQVQHASWEPASLLDMQ